MLAMGTCYNLQEAKNGKVFLLFPSLAQHTSTFSFIVFFTFLFTFFSLTIFICRGYSLCALQQRRTSNSRLEIQCTIRNCICCRVLSSVHCEFDEIVQCICFLKNFFHFLFLLLLFVFIDSSPSFP